MKNFDEKAIIERIRTVRNQHCGSRGKSKFAHDLGISASTYSYYERDRVPPINVLVRICDVTGTSLEWLITGREPGSQPAGKQVPAGEDSLNKSCGVLFAKLHSLLAENPGMAEPVTAFIDLLDEKRRSEKEPRSKASSAQASPAQIQMPPSQAQQRAWIPVLGRTAAGIVHFWDREALPEPQQAVTELNDLVKKYVGKSIVGSVDGEVSIDLQAPVLVDGLRTRRANLIQVSGEAAEQLVEFVECGEILELFPDSFALQIDGDSMSPRINDGDIVILSPSVPAAQGHVAIARLANQIGVTCKLIRTTGETVHLIPINEKYEAKVVAKKDLVWALAVLCHVSV